MESLLQPLRALKEFEDLERQLKKLQGTVQVFGCIDSQKPHIVYACNNGGGAKLIVTFSEQKARELYEEYRFFERNVVYYPAKDILFYQSDLRGNLLSQQRMAAVKAILEQEDPVVVTTMDALMDRLPPLSTIQEGILSFRVGESLNLDQVAVKLVQMGYEKNYQAEASGQYARRGGIIDIYPLTEENPIRIELWGDEIDSIRSFDAESQRSIEELSEIKLYPASELVLTDEILKTGLLRLEKEGTKIYDRFRKEMKTEEAFRVKSALDMVKEEIETQVFLNGIDSYLPYFFENCVSFLDYFQGKDFLAFLDEPARCLERGRVTQAEFAESMKHRLEKGYILPGQMTAIASVEEVVALLNLKKCVALTTLDGRLSEFSIQDRYHIFAKTVNPYNGSMELLQKDLRLYKKNGYQVLLLSGSRTRAKRLSEDLLHDGLSAFYTEDYDHLIKPGEVMLAYGKMKKGFEYPELKFVLLSESDIFGVEKKAKKKTRKRKDGERILDFADLNIGDYVIHANHGLGVYRGLEQVEVDHAVKDYITIEYQGGGKLYIQATQLDMIQKYGSSEGRKPKLNTLGGKEWQKTKTKVKTAVAEIAKELVELYAARQNQRGFAYGVDTVWQKEFEELFPFEETDDQLIAIEDTKRDMESTKIMDRLICGDVGYGKTEIALRAAFKAALDGKQVVYLVPTTILAHQHYNTFSQRMKDFPVRVDLLSRFRTPGQIKNTIEALRKGAADIVIGTHRALSKDVTYKDLGLLIIDEEQRFGVTHKEKIKQVKNSIDVLTLTATPIPRTLHMSLIGIRDMSVLEEPPMDRLPIQTYVMEYDEEIVREAIHRELARNGQVYYVFNRIDKISDITMKIASLVPDATVAFAHGRMNERELERIMYEFINGEIDVLVSTTIIETGLDISNVNTIMIHDADNMGLSQLYQLRGRVGRSNRTAYAFLLYRRNKLLREVAEKRLSAIREYTELGSGFKIAMRDLEIRGAGNLLGAAQHGHMEAVGYDLYVRMLNEAVRTEKGEEVVESFDTTVDMEVSAYIPPTYIPNESHKLDVYKRIALVETEEEQEDMLEELIDRFGEPPRSVQNLLKVTRIRALAHELYFSDVIQRGHSYKLVFYERANIRVEQIPVFVESYGKEMIFTADSKSPYFLCTKKRQSKPKDEVTLDEVLEILGRAKEFLS